MKNTNETIQALINKPYGANLRGQSKRYICWHFCREVYTLLGLQLKHFHLTQGLIRTDEPAAACIVLFHAVVNWHSGVVWPDGLHFIHACPQNIFDPNPVEYVVRKDRLTLWPYNRIIEGYYNVSCFVNELNHANNTP